MKTRFTGIIILTLLLGCCTLAWGATYYVDSQAGSDTNDGLSELTPLKTITKVNTLTLHPADSVLFKRGGVWRCPTDDYLKVTSGDQTGVITYGAYGSGDYPVLLGSYDLSNSAEWKNEGNNIWSYGEDYVTDGVELLSNPSFNTNTSGWSLYVDTAGAQASIVRDTSSYDSIPASLKITVTKSGTTGGSQIQLYASGIQLINNKCYVLRFKMKATNPFNMEKIILFKDGAPYTEYYSLKSPTNFAITTEWQSFTVLYRANTTASDARINFSLGKVVPANTSVYIDSVSFQQFKNDSLFSEAGSLIFNNEAEVGFKKDGITGLAAQGDFYSDIANFKLYLYSAYNPGIFYSNIEAATNRDIIYQENAHYVLYHNLSLKYGGACGFNGGSTDNITVRECDLSYIGGSYQYDTVRYGNAIQFWENAHDNLVEGCRVWEIYDAALTSQGINANSVYNLIFRNNVIWNSEYSFEFWNGPQTSSSQDVYFENNTCVNAGGGWGHFQREDPNGRHLMFWNSDAQLNRIFVRNNIFYDAVNSLVRWDNLANIPVFILDYNLYYNSYHDASVEDKGDLAAITWYKNYDYPLGFISYKQDTGQDYHSLTGDPLFVDPSQHDYHLKVGSPAIKTGENGVCMGAYEFSGAQSTTNQPPSANEQSFTINEDNSLIITLTGSDPEGDSLTYAIVTSPTHGTLSGNPPNLVYTPNLNYNGSDAFSFKVNDGNSNSSPANVYITITPVNDPPATPQGLKATAASQTQINLSWSASADPDVGDTVVYNLYRNSSTTPLNSTPITATNYSDTGLQAATTYSYQIEAVDNHSAKSAKSSSASATASSVVATPGAPASLTATALSSKRIKLSWQDKANNESGFKIMRSTDNVNFSKIATVSGNVTTYTNSNLTSGRTYYYKVCAYNSSGDSSYTNTASAKARR